MAETGISILSVIPIRREPAHTSELVSQLLYGESYDVLDVYEDWVNIRCHYDQYEGWISKKQHQPISNLSKTNFVLASFIGKVIQKEQVTNIVLGSSLPFIKSSLSLFKEIELVGKHTDPSGSINLSDLEHYSKMYLNSPYLWGGRSVFGIDCSGFTQVVFKLLGILLPRDAYQQAELGKPIAFADEVEAGDLAFFDNTEGKITHVGILLSKNQIIHASGKVRIDRFDHLGIYNAEESCYTHNLRIIKRLR